MKSEKNETQIVSKINYTLIIIIKSPFSNWKLSIILLTMIFFLFLLDKYVLLLNEFSIKLISSKNVFILKIKKKKIHFHSLFLIPLWIDFYFISRSLKYLDHLYSSRNLFS